MMVIEIENYINDERQDDTLRIRVRNLTEEAATCAAKWGVQSSRSDVPTGQLLHTIPLAPTPTGHRRRGELRFG
jgi:hypothetical protein